MALPLSLSVLAKQMNSRSSESTISFNPFIIDRSSFCSDGDGNTQCAA